MTTLYTHTITLAVPENLILPANHLAALVGESAADINTFTTMSYTKDSVEYAVAHTVCTETVIQYIANPAQLIADDSAPEHVDLELVQQAIASLNTPGGILLAVDVDPIEQFAQWELAPIVSDDLMI